MRCEVDVTDVLRTADHFHGAGDRMLADLERRATAHAADAVRFIQRRYRTGAPYTTETRTAIRAGGLIDAYDSRVDRVTEGGRRGMEVGVGGIKPGVSGEVLQRLRIHEGYDVAGNRVESFRIVPRAAKHLRFRLPPEKGGGFVTVDEVILRPRPSFPAVQDRLKPVLQQDIRDSFAQVVQ